MKVNAKLSRLADDAFVPWSTEELREMTVNELDLSSCFLRVRFEELIKGLDLHWLNLFANVGLFVRLEDVCARADFPEDLDVVWPILCVAPTIEKGEVCLLGLRSGLVHELMKNLVPGIAAVPADILCEYLIRRLVSSICKCWTFREKIQLFVLPRNFVQQVEIIGAAHATLQIGSYLHDLHFGFGVESVKFLEKVWTDYSRAEGANLKRSSLKPNNSAGNAYLSIELCDIKVPPTRTLLDYLCAGAIIDLGVPFSNEVSISLNGRQVASGNLFRSGEDFAVQVIDTEFPVDSESQGETSLKVEIASVSLSNRELVRELVRGAVLKCNEPPRNKVHLIIGREIAATGELGVLRNNLAIVVGG